MPPAARPQDAVTAPRRWRRTYLLVTLLAALVVLLLWRLTATFNLDRLA